VKQLKYDKKIERKEEKIRLVRGTDVVVMLLVSRSTDFINITRGRKEFEERVKNSVYHLAVDLHFIDKMNEKEQKSLITQILTMYGMNKRTETPFHFYLCEYQGDFATKVRGRTERTSMFFMV